MKTESAKATHTPVPWVAKKIQLGVNDYFFEVYGSHISHEVCQTIVRDVSKEQAWLDEDEANAHLIAAAPELLDALKKLLAVSDSCQDWMPEQAREHDSACAAAEAAIKKAEAAQ